MIYGLAPGDTIKPAKDHFKGTGEVFVPVDFGNRIALRIWLLLINLLHMVSTIETI